MVGYGHYSQNDIAKGQHLIGERQIDSSFEIFPLEPSPFVMLQLTLDLVPSRQAAKDWVKQGQRIASVSIVALSTHRIELQQIILSWPLP